MSQAQPDDQSPKPSSRAREARGNLTASPNPNTKGRDKYEATRHEEYLKRKGLIETIAPCEYQQGILIEQLDQETNYDRQTRAWGLEPLRTKSLDANPVHKALLARIIQFNEGYKAYQEKLRYKSELEITLAEKDKLHRMARKKRIYDAVKALMSKLIYATDEALLQDQLARVTGWLEDKIAAAENSSLTKDKAQKAELAKKRQQAQAMAAYEKGFMKLPEIACRCGDKHAGLEDALDGPMGTLSLKAVLAQTEARGAARAAGARYASSSALGASQHYSQAMLRGSGQLGLVGALGAHQSNGAKSHAEMGGQAGGNHKASLRAARAAQELNLQRSLQQKEMSRSIDRMRDKAHEMNKHRHSLLLTTMKWGLGKTKMETDLLQRHDRQLGASSFQDLGIRGRAKVEASAYESNREFLQEGETSDEDLTQGRYDEGRDLYQVNETNENDPQDRGVYASAKAPGTKRLLQASPSLGLATGPPKPAFRNMECEDLLCRARTEMKLPIDERPELMKFYMHKRMVNQAQTSLNSKNVDELVGKELRRRRIAQLRLHHQKLLGVRVMDKNMTFNGLRVNGPPVEDERRPKKRKPGDEGEDDKEASSDEEILNAVNLKQDSISLSIYDDSNLHKKDFQRQYYSSIGDRSEPAQSRGQIVAKYRSIDPDRRHTLATSAAAIEPLNSSVTSIRGRFGLHLAGRAGNISGLHIEEEDSKFFQLPKNTKLYDTRQMEKAEAEIEEAAADQAELERQQAPKRKAPPKDKKAAAKKKGAAEADAPAEGSGEPPEPPLTTVLRDLIRSERFEERLTAMAEMDGLQARLSRAGVRVPAEVLQKAIFLPEDEMPAPGQSGPKYPRISEMLYKNPIPKPAKKGKGKKGKS